MQKRRTKSIIFGPIWRDGFKHIYIYSFVFFAINLKNIFFDKSFKYCRSLKKFYAFQNAIQNGMDFVMKSQMDGGHGIYFDDQIGQMLKKMTMEERGAFILMKKIKPVVAKVLICDYPFLTHLDIHDKIARSHMSIYANYLIRFSQWLNKVKLVL